MGDYDRVVENYNNARAIRSLSELGKQYDRLEKYPQAFSHYRQANELEKQLNAKSECKADRVFLLYHR